MKTILISILCLVAAAASADIKPTAAFSAETETTESGVQVNYLTIELIPVGDPGPVPRIMVASKSAAANPENWTLEYTDGNEITTFKVTQIRQRPSSGDLVAEFWAPAPDLGDADPNKDDVWILKVSGSDGVPALTIVDETGTERVFETLTLPMGGSTDGPFIGDFHSPVAPNFSVSGGDDGTLFGFDFSWDSGYRINDEHEIFGYHAEFEGAFTPEPDENLLLYGRFAGEAGVLKGVALPESNLMHGNLLFDLNGRFEADQQVDNYNGTVGIGAWAFVSIAPLERLGHGLRTILNPGGRVVDDSSDLIFFAGYDYVADSKREPGMEEQGDNRFRFRVRYRLPLRDSLELPFLATPFQIDGVIDASGIYDLHTERFLAEWSPSLEFSPTNQAQAKMAFVLSYHQGKISPTFVDEEVFLAGLRFKF